MASLFDSGQGQEIFHFFKASGTAVGPIREGLSGTDNPGVKRPGLENVHHLCLLPSLRMSGVIPPVLDVFIGWTGMTLISGLPPRC